MRIRNLFFGIILFIVIVVAFVGMFIMKKSYDKKLKAADEAVVENNKVIEKYKEQLSEYENMISLSVTDGRMSVIELKDGMLVTSDELYVYLKNHIGLESLLNIVDKKILEDKYKDRLDEAKNEADKQFKEVQNTYGNDLDTIVSQYTNMSVDDYKESLYLGVLKDMAIEDYCKKQITDTIVDEEIEAKAKEYLEKNKIANVLAMKELREEYGMKFADFELSKKYSEYIAMQEAYYSQFDKTFD